MEWAEWDSRKSQNIHLSNTLSPDCLNDDEGLLSICADVPYEYREAPISKRLEDVLLTPESMSRTRRALCLASIMMLSSLSSGCLALTIQREIMESWRDAPEHTSETITVGWSVTFDTGAELNSVLYENETDLVFDETVSKLVITFTAQIPYSSTIEDIIGNETNELRYIEARLWAPGTQSSGGDPFWEVRATQGAEHRKEWTDSTLDFIEGTWTLEVEARGYGMTTPIEQLSFHDHFDLYATVTKPCVHFPQAHDDGECTFLSELED